MPPKRPVERGVFRTSGRTPAEAQVPSDLEGAARQVADPGPSPFLFSMINRLSVLEADVRTQRRLFLGSQARGQVLVLDNEQAEEKIGELNGIIAELESAAATGGTNLTTARGLFTAIRSAQTQIGRLQYLGQEPFAKAIARGLLDGREVPGLQAAWDTLDSALVQMESHLFSPEE